MLHVVWSWCNGVVSCTCHEQHRCSLTHIYSHVCTTKTPHPPPTHPHKQVHLAKVNGRRVVVKVQRPGLKDLFDIDLKNVRVIAQWLQAVDPKSDGAARDWVAIYDECSRILYQEIDYELEGKNADTFRTNFADKDWIKVPEVLWEYTTSKVCGVLCGGGSVYRH